MFRFGITTAALLFFTLTPEAHAYIGPGAGFAAAGSGLVFITSFLMLLATIVLGPAIWAIRWMKGRKASRRSRASKVVIVGLDGLDPKLVDSFMQEGLLPNLKELATHGAYQRLKTTLPALSPVAWSSFQTGVNPGAHNIYDFITRDKRTCLPQLSSTRTESNPQKALFGIFKRGPRSSIRLLRGGKPFWKILGEHGIFSNIIRVPVSYPPEPFNGTILSGMCTPDIRGSQGTFTFYSTRDDKSVELTDGTGGVFHRFREDASGLHGILEGPENTGKSSSARAFIPFCVQKKSTNSAILNIGEDQVTLTTGVLSDWIRLSFSVDGRKIPGIARFCLRSTEPECALYISPVNVNPEDPILPISAPGIFSRWLSKKQGLFGTLGLLEDTWGRNEHALDDTLFLQQSYDSHAEREKMFFNVLERTRKGLCVCVFDASDRVQHMFWRYIDPTHPSPLQDESFRHTIKDLYIKMDDLVARIRRKLHKNDWLIVMSDHGFASFRRGVNINTWLMENGYLFLKEGANPHADYLQSVDWTKTRAYAIGLAGIFINKAGRERQGIVTDSEFQQLKDEISAKLQTLQDPVSKGNAVHAMYDSRSAYSGMYAAEAPDLIVGYADGYRVSWDSVTGTLEPEIFSDNTKAWSGDHHVDPSLVPGILLSNRAITSQAPNILDIAPTVLNIFGVPVPKYMEGSIIQ